MFIVVVTLLCEFKHRVANMENSSQTIQFKIQDDLTIVGDAWGSPDDPPVILTHGAGQTRHAWGATAKKLAAHGWYAIAVDLRGHGDSSWVSDGNYEMEAYAHDLARMAAQLTQKPAVVGASLGGISSLLATLQHGPDILTALVLVDITPFMSQEGVSEVLSFMAAKVEEGFASLEEAADTIAAFLPNRPRPKSLEGLAKNLRLNEDGRYRWHWDPRFMDSRNPHEPRDNSKFIAAAKQLKIPTLLVRGRMSTLISEESAKQFLELVPHAQYVDVKNAGHMIAGDRNDIFTKAVVDFLAGLSAKNEP